MVSISAQATIETVIETPRTNFTDRQVRCGDRFSPPPRSKRVFHSLNHWYFDTREGHSVGPYHSKHAAEQAAQEYVEFAKTASQAMLDKLLTSITKT